MKSERPNVQEICNAGVPAQDFLRRVADQIDAGDHDGFDGKVVLILSKAIPDNGGFKTRLNHTCSNDAEAAGLLSLGTFCLFES